MKTRIGGRSTQMDAPAGSISVSHLINMVSLSYNFSF